MTSHVDDGYLGSGKLLKQAIEKYGVDNFSRVILKECNSIEEMYEYESIVVDQQWVDDPTTYNLKLGGTGGWDFINMQGETFFSNRALLISERS